MGEQRELNAGRLGNRFRIDYAERLPFFFFTEGNGNTGEDAIMSLDVYEAHRIGDLLRTNAYPGRGIVVGKTADGAHAAIAYFIMGRSENSRNRIFVERGEDVTIYPFDESKVEDPSLIIYSPIRVLDSRVIVTNGDQTDTIYEGLQQGSSFAGALEARTFEPDAPNFTPRISALLDLGVGDFSYQMSILKSADAQGSACSRYTFSYPAIAGVGHFLHTYHSDGSPIPTFQGEPERICLDGTIDEFTQEIWNSLHAENKISLYTRYIDLNTGKVESRLHNKNQ